MRMCAAIGCRNGSRTLENRRYVKSNNITFHGFPLKDTKRLMLWIERVGRADFMPTEHSTLCSEHFTEEDFKYQPFTNRRCINGTAVPSKFSHKEQTEKRERTSWPCVFAESVVVVHEEPPAKETSTQTDLTMEDIKALEHKNKEQQNLIGVYEERLKIPSLSADKISDGHLTRFTGFSACHGEDLGTQDYSVVNVKREVPEPDEYSSTHPSIEDQIASYERMVADLRKTENMKDDVHIKVEIVDADELESIRDAESVAIMGNEVKSEFSGS